MPAKKEDTPSTIERSPEKVQKTYEKTLDSAHEQYDSEERAHRTAWSAVKHVAEKQGDHWELKDEQGPSDEQSALSGRAARRGPRREPRRNQRVEVQVGSVRGRQAGGHRGAIEDVQG